jgi:hypothetical protein
MLANQRRKELEHISNVADVLEPQLRLSVPSHTEESKQTDAVNNDRHSEMEGAGLQLCGGLEFGLSSDSEMAGHAHATSSPC